MANTVIESTLRQKVWDKRFFLEYVRDNRFRRYMGTTENAVIQMREQLTKSQGDTVYIPLVGAVPGANQSTPGYNDGSTSLVNNEKQLANIGSPLVIRTVRDAVVVNALEQQASAIDILNAARQSLKNIAMGHLRDDVIRGFDDRLGSGIHASDNAWDTANGPNNRVLYGDSLSNRTPGNFTASLGAVTAAMQLDAATISLLKRMAKTTNYPAIRPIRVGEDDEWFVMFVGSYQFRDLKNDPVIQQANREAWIRFSPPAQSNDNPLFRDGDIIYDGVIIREIPEIVNVAEAQTGAASVNVEPGFFCGAQAAGVGWAMRTRSTIRREDDYQYERGVGFMELRRVDKLRGKGDVSGPTVDWGMITWYGPSVGD